MTSQELRKKFLDFFEKNNHKIIPSASLMPSEEEQLEGKKPVLFTSAGMQPLIPYLLGKPYPEGKRLANVQKCLRTDDIDQVGDAVHHTFFEMLGNWSLGDYWKDEAIKLSFEFLTKELEIPIEKLAVSIFAGDKDAPKDDESAKTWKSLGIPEERIFYFGKEHNWWPTGEKSGLCGPDTEMFYWIGEGKPEGKPNEDSRWVEIWNDVFMQFNRKEDGPPAGGLEDLPQKNVDTGMGLERTLAVLNGKDNDYETDLFEPIIAVIQKSKNNYSERSQRIIADHLRAAVFLVAEGVEPSNKDRGYILRRLIRRAYTQVYLSGDKELTLSVLVKPVVNIYEEEYPDLSREIKRIEANIEAEEKNYKKILKEGLDIWARSVSKLKWLSEEEQRQILFGLNVDLMPSTKELFLLYQSHGLPPEIIELITGVEYNKKEFQKLFKEHQEKSRTASAGMFKGGLADHSEIVTKYHTATHLLHQALRDVLGLQVIQKGSNITSERLRFDFSFGRKMTDEEIKQVEDLVNEKIKEDLKVTKEIMGKEEALKSKALGFFNEKYGDKVTVYTIGDPSTSSGFPFSREICGGPHIEHTGVIGKIKITKEEAVSFGIRRIRAEIVIT